MDTKRQYEVVFIVDPTVDDEVAKLTDNFKQIVVDQGGAVTKAETMGKRQLAYEILHKKEGTFVLMEIQVVRSQNSSVVCA
jgi:small subunit ribosomal protein S6